MHVRLLGTAAGGGHPQWNCACRSCSRAREAGLRVRTQDSVAVSGDGRRWYLVNASPDVTFQVEACPALHPGPGPRETPIRGVLLSDAELDHCLGLLALRQCRDLDVHATATVIDTLAGPLPLRPVVDAFGRWRWLEVRPGRTIELEGGLEAIPFALGGHAPRFVPPADRPDWTVGWRLAPAGGGSAAVYAPCVACWSPDLERQVGRADTVLVDGTFWSETEMIDAGVGDRTAADLGHLPIAGPRGSLERMAALTAVRRLYVHVNNTNPILDQGSPERRRLAELGIGLGEDGMEWEA